MPPPHQQEELDALQAIYDDITIAERLGAVIIRTNVPSIFGHVAVTVRLPPGYPEADGPDIELSGLPRGGMHDALMSKLAEMIDQTPGEPVLFTVLSFLREELATATANGADDDDEGGLAQLEAAALTEVDYRDLAAASGGGREIEIVHGTPWVDRKSTFQAHIARVKSLDDVRAVLGVLCSNTKIARATHNIRAFRFVDATTGALMADNDDDGEDAAGGRLAELLHVMGVVDAVVVVSRWFGGVLLGPSR